jgi:hypothetical protein
VRRGLASGALALLLVAAGPARPEGEGRTVALGGVGDLNSHVLAVVHSYPLDGTHAFHWPKSGGWEGTTRDLVWAGEKLASGDPQGRCYCCGLVYEVWVRALERALGAPGHPDLAPATLREARLRFFGDSKAGERRKLVAFALPSLGLGKAIERREDARAGDLLQLWRHDGSGHQAVFVNWVWRKGKIVGLTYWSTQTSTRGIGYHTELFGPEGVKEDEVYLARAGWWGEGR